MLWVDKHRPLTLEKLDYHASLSTRLGKVVQFTAAAPTHALLPPPLHTDSHAAPARDKHQAAAGELPHMLFYGPSGAGKKTRIMALLRAIFGSGVEKVE